MLYVKYISIKKIKGFKFPNESPFCFNKFVINLYFYCIAMYVFVICTLWNLLKLSLWTNISPIFVNVPCILSKWRDQEIHIKYTLLFSLCLLYPYVLYTWPWFFPSFLKSLEVADLLLSCFVLLLLRNLMPNWFSFLCEWFGHFAWRPRGFFFFFFFFFISLTRICLEVDHSGSVLLDFCPLIFWV